jgi:large subunit ribosomal protein L3
VIQIKTKDKEGYDAVKVAYGNAKERNVNKPSAGIFKKAGVSPARYMKEIRFDDIAGYEIGQKIECGAFVKGDKVDVSGVTKGRGYTGTIQRWNTHRGPMAHGAGPVHRHQGSLGANSSPSRVFKNKKMPGQYGAERVTVQNLEVVKVDSARNILMIAGGIPGADGGLVFIRNTCKKASSSKWFREPKAAASAKK